MSTTNRWWFAAAAAAIGMALATPVAQAGDPCPIEVSIVNLGLPDWAKPSLVKKVKDGDAFLSKLAKAGDNGDDCTKAMVYTTDIETDGREIKRETLKAKLVDKKRRFQCKAASRVLRKLKATGDTFIYYRGHRRILLATPDKSMCILSSKADKMSERSIRKLFVKLTKDFVARTATRTHSLVAC